MNQKGFIIPLLAVILLIAASIGGYVFVQFMDHIQPFMTE